MQLQLGCDPELFVRSKATGLSVPAVGMVPGTKKEPFAVPDGAVQIDGLALEFNTAPALTANQFDYNIGSVLGCLEQMIPDDVEFDIRGSTIFDTALLADLPRESLELGCDPDYSAYTMGENPRPVPPEAGLRTASGHIHIGLGMFPDWRNERHFDDMARLCRALDRFVGLQSVIIDPDPVRRVLYGRAGAMRIKEYGMEYRVPSNGWIKSSEDRKLMFHRVNQTIEWLMKADVTRDVVDKDVELAINTSDVQECQAMLQFFTRGE